VRDRVLSGFDAKTCFALNEKSLDQFPIKTILARFVGQPKCCRENGSTMP